MIKSGVSSLDKNIRLFQLCEKCSARMSTINVVNKYNQSTNNHDHLIVYADICFKYNEMKINCVLIMLEGFKVY